MKRRKFLRYGAIATSSFLLNIDVVNYNSSNSLLSASMSHKKLYDWVILYWMPYDNNLSSFVTPILQMLKKGVNSENILVVVQSDFSGEKQLSRHIISKGKINIQKLDTANSGSEEVFAEYIEWAKSQYKAKKWAIVFLGHGGRLDEISPDENPTLGKKLETKWMNIQKLSNIIADFNREVNNSVELLFFQNCNKGTIEAHYTVRNTAKYTLSSQLTLGAPNYYYESMLEFLGHHPEINGGQLAEKIIEFERSDMYYSYITNNRAVRQLPEKINSLIDSIILSGIKFIETDELKPYFYVQDRLVDFILFFETITSKSKVDKQKLNDFISFFKQSVIYRLQKDGTLLTPKPEYKIFSGLGMFFPTNRNELDKYRYLQVFSDLKLVELFNSILFN